MNWSDLKINDIVHLSPKKPNLSERGEGIYKVAKIEQSSSGAIYIRFDHITGECINRLWLKQKDKSIKRDHAFIVHRVLEQTINIKLISVGTTLNLRDYHD